jgi:hypothetical protein
VGFGSESGPDRRAQGQTLRDRRRDQARGRRKASRAGLADHPTDETRAIAIPPKVKRHLGLDADASWIVLDEANEFFWPGVDLRPVSRSKPGVWTFGVLPTEIFDEIQAKLRGVLQQRRTLRSD